MTSLELLDILEQIKAFEPLTILNVFNIELINESE